MIGFRFAGLRRAAFRREVFRGLAAFFMRACYARVRPGSIAV